MTLRPEPLSLLHITDFHILQSASGTLLGINTDRYFRAAVDMAFANNARYDLTVITGDLAQDPSASSYQRIKAKLNGCNTPFVCLPGNHDDYPLMQQILNTEKISCRKQTLLGNWQVICLNTQILGATGGRLVDEELQFLTQCLEEHPSHNALIAVHHHCIECKSAWMDTMIIDNSHELFAITERFSQAKVIITGHLHQQKEDTVGSVRVLSTPSTCFQFTPNSPGFSVAKTAPGFRVINLYADGHIETEVFRLPNALDELDMTIERY